MKRYQLSAMSRANLTIITWFYFLTLPLLSSSSIPQTCFGFRVSCPNPNSICFSSQNFPILPKTANTKTDQSKSFSLTNGDSVTCSLLEPKKGEFEKKGLNKNDKISCKAPLIPDNWIKASNGVINDDETGQTGQFSDYLDSINVEINPKVLDWGSNSLYKASFLTLNVKNLNKDRVLEVYEPYSSDSQFYPYEFENILLKHGENISIIFIFLPRILGSNLGQIVIQTNFGGFILQAKGVAIESPFKINPLMGITLQKNRALSKNLSIYNPFDDILNIEELAIWISASESVHKSNHAICKLKEISKNPTYNKLDEVLKESFNNEWFSLDNNNNNNNNGFVKMDIKPGNKWEVLSKNEGTIVELKLQGRIEGEIFGAICLKLRNQKDISTIVVPFELEVHNNNNNKFVTVSLSLDRHLSCNGDVIFSLYLSNKGPDLLTVLNIFEERESKNSKNDEKFEKLFEIKYLKNLMLFSETDTILGLVSFKNEKGLSAISDVELVQLLKCNLVVETNYSFSPLVKIPCEDFYKLGLEKDNGEVLGGILEDSTENKINNNPFEETEASNILISNFISHAKNPEYTILSNNILSLPLAQIGSQISKPIQIKNPSNYPITVQLILNSEEQISDCKSQDDTFAFRSPKSIIIETKSFSIPENSVTEALINPFESILLGPIVFYPSRRCNYASSALIRSNLSGVESVFLKGSGGVHLISLLEGSEYVDKIEFNLEKNINSSLLSSLSCPPCDYKFSQDLYAKNTGDLPLEIKRIRVSGKDCKLDGFAIKNNCRGFFLKPGDIVPVPVSYRSNFLFKSVQRDFEIEMAEGIFVISMMVNLPDCMLKECGKKNSGFFWWVFLVGLFGVFLVGFFVTVNNFNVGFKFKRDSYLRLDGGDKNSDKVRGQSEKRPIFHHGNNNKGSSRAIQNYQQKQEKPFINNDTYPILQTSLKRVETQPATPTAAPLKTTKDPATPQTDLTIKANKNKRRNKKKSKLEASSSLSSNSNSSPNSPLSNGSNGSTPSHEKQTRNPFAISPLKNEKKEKEKKITDRPSEKGIIAKQSPVVSPVFSGLCSNGNSPSFFSRAPGPSKEKVANREEKEGVFAKEFTYDIWADHFSGRWVYAEGYDGNYSKSFFAIQPLDGCNGNNGSFKGGVGKNDGDDVVTGVYGMN